MSAPSTSSTTATMTSTRPLGHPFIVMIDRRWRPCRLAAAALLATCGLLAAPSAQAQFSLLGTIGKLATDLTGAVLSPLIPGTTWSREVEGVRQLQLVVVTNGSDADMSDLRAHVVRLGGAVRARHSFARALTIQLPAYQVPALAARSDIVSIAPNRNVRRTASQLERASGVDGPAVRAYDSKVTQYSGLDGTGVGIAIIDSGVMSQHRSFKDRNGLSRVAKNLNLRNAKLEDWLSTGDDSISLQPGTLALTTYENLLNVGSSSTYDAYGHGTHVAAVAAGRAFYQTPDTTGIAPGAKVYDLKVLDKRRHGQCVRRAGSHPVGDLPRPGIQHPRAEPQHRRRQHPGLGDRPAVHRRAQRHGRRCDRGGRRRQLRPDRQEPGSLRHHQRPGQRP